VHLKHAELALRCVPWIRRRVVQSGLLLFCARPLHIACMWEVELWKRFNSGVPVSRGE
jgi:hypothetical protein